LKYIKWLYRVDTGILNDNQVAVSFLQRDIKLYQVAVSCRERDAKLYHAAVSCRDFEICHVAVSCKERGTKCSLSCQVWRLMCFRCSLPVNVHVNNF
jgi:hypothetical protein